MSANYRGRFAPSPTGSLHFGSLVAALASYCDARAHDGEWVVRIEDVDLPRNRPGASAELLETLRRYGFAWDGPVVYQSARIGLYEHALASLQEQRLLYSCRCSRKQLEAAPLGLGGERIYPGTCRNGAAAADDPAVQQSWRVRVTEQAIDFVDRVQGPQSQMLARDSGDFVIKRSDGLFAYQLAVVVDDADQGITHVVRGADLLTSTPRQLWLQHLLHLSTPAYLHHPIAIDVRGAKLSKETYASKLGDDPLPALLQAWTFLGQLPAPSRPTTVDEFWRWAVAQWETRRISPVTALPAAGREL